VILRASGSLTSYPDSFTLALSPSVAPSSAVTVLTSVPASADDPSVLCWVGGAEAVWLAGGNQWDCLGRWPPELHTSLGEATFDARFGTETSAEALADALRPEASLSYPSFAAPELHGVLVDSHFSDRDHEGRLLELLARLLEEKERSQVMGIGLDEGVAVG
jgi:cyanophycinase-like exopeptidase